jgi:superfamily I DNA/RNA helicase
MRLYEERLQAYQAVDFDDLIGLPLKLLQRDEEARAKLAAASSATCWSTSTRTPTPCSTSC